MRLIDANKLRSDIYNGVQLKYFMGRTYDKAYKNMNVILDAIADSPTIDPVKHGYWIHHGLYLECSCCRGGKDREQWVEPTYCEDCGAKMDEEVQHETD